MILKLRIDSQDLKRFILETYLAAEMDALEEIVLVDVVILLDTVQMTSHADHQRSFKKWRTMSSHAASDTPQKHDCHPSLE